MPSSVILVLTQVPDKGTAETLARTLLQHRLAACVTIGAPVDSLYHWRGQIETANEVPVAIKTTAERYSAVETTIRTTHPYELPEIVAVPVIDGLPPYLRWVVDETVELPPAG